MLRKFMAALIFVVCVFVAWLGMYLLSIPGNKVVGMITAAVGVASAALQIEELKK